MIRPLLKPRAHGDETLKVTQTKHLARAASIAGLAFLSSCTDKDVSNAISKAIIHFLGWVARILLIAMAS